MPSWNKRKKQALLTGEKILTERQGRKESESRISLNKEQAKVFEEEANNLFALTARINEMTPKEIEKIEAETVDRIVRMGYVGQENARAWVQSILYGVEAAGKIYIGSKLGKGMAKPSTAPSSPASAVGTPYN